MVAALTAVLVTAGCSADAGRVTTAPMADEQGTTTTTGATASTATAATSTTATSTTATSTAEAEIRQAFATFANVNVTSAERDAAVEDGELASTQREARLQQRRSDVAPIAFVVDAIRFVSATEAAVDFHLQYGNGPSPIAPGVIHGKAIVQGGHWRVSKSTTCALATLGGMACLE